MSKQNITIGERAEKFGELAARKLFGQRGNHSEIHLSEKALADIVAVAFEVGVVCGSVNQTGNPHE